MWALGKEKRVLGGTAPSERSANTCTQRSHLCVRTQHTESCIVCSGQCAYNSKKGTSQL